MRQKLFSVILIISLLLGFVSERSTWCLTHMRLEHAMWMILRMAKILALIGPMPM